VDRGGEKKRKKERRALDHLAVGICWLEPSRIRGGELTVLCGQGLSPGRRGGKEKKERGGKRRTTVHSHLDDVALAPEEDYSVFTAQQQEERERKKKKKRKRREKASGPPVQDYSQSDCTPPCRVFSLGKEDGEQCGQTRKTGGGGGGGVAPARFLVPVLLLRLFPCEGGGEGKSDLFTPTPAVTEGRKKTRSVCR